MYSPGVSIFYNGTHASIPSGWTRNTSYDGKFIKGTANGVNPGTNGGASTHSHTSPSHYHSLNNHTHTATTSTVSGPIRQCQGGSYIIGAHYHTLTTGGIVAANSGSTAVTYGSVSNNPPYYEMILIKSSGYNLIPNNGVILSKNTSRSGLTFHSSAASKFIRVAGAGANAGSTGGSSTNIHDISHAHTGAVHTHQSAVTSTPLGNSLYGDKQDYVPNPGNGAANGHGHSFTPDNATAPIDNYSGSLTTAETVEPAYTTLNPFINSSGSNVLASVGDVGLWDGTLASIPIGWVLCDGNNGTTDMRSRFLKVPASAATPTTGGSNTHSHASQAHSHNISTGHAHTGTTQIDASSYDTRGTGVNTIQTHTHTFTTSTDGASYTSANTSADSASNEPEYRTIAFIQLQFLPIGGAAIRKMLN